MAATYEYVLRKDKINRKGEMPIYLRIIKNREINYVSTGVRIEEKHWDEVKKKVKPSHPNSGRMNALLAHTLNQYVDRIFEAERQDLSISVKSIKRKVTGRDSPDLFAIGQEIIDRLDRNKKVGTRNNIRAILNKVADYTGKSRLPMKDITESWLNSYEHHLLTKLENKAGTVSKNMRVIRQVFNYAEKRDLISSTANPFKSYQVRTVKTSRQFLTMGEITSLAQLELPAGSWLSLARDMFVFSCFAGGIRVSDVILLRWGNILDDRLTLTIRKTQTSIAFLIPNPALAIIERYRPPAISATHYVFPAMPTEVDVDDPEALHTAISRITALLNKMLRTLVNRAGIEKHISFHCSRHSFAINMLRKDVGIEYVSKILGHAAIRETQIYARIANSELDKAMEVFNS